MTKSFFLHWGPGSHAAVERLWFGNSPSIDFWDQPLFESPATPNAFSLTVDAAAARLEALSRESGGAKIPLIAHSFGGQVATALAQRMPGKIESITLVSSTPSTAKPFLRLAQWLLKHQQDQLSPEIRQALEGAVGPASSSLAPETFWPLVNVILQVPAFVGYYFHPRSSAAKARFFELAMKTAPIHLPTALSVTNEWFGAEASLSSASPYSGPVRMLAGTGDPLGEIDEDFSGWKKRFPQLKGAEPVEAGHFIHFEEPSALGLS